MLQAEPPVFTSPPVLCHVVLRRFASCSRSSLLLPTVQGVLQDLTLNHSSLLSLLLSFVLLCKLQHIVTLSTTVQGVLQDVELNQRMTEVCRKAVRAFVEDRTDKDGRVSIKALNKFAQMTGLGAQEPWVNVIKVCLLCPGVTMRFLIHMFNFYFTGDLRNLCKTTHHPFCKATHHPFHKT